MIRKSLYLDGVMFTNNNFTFGGPISHRFPIDFPGGDVSKPITIFFEDPLTSEPAIDTLW